MEEYPRNGVHHHYYTKEKSNHTYQEEKEQEQEEEEEIDFQPPEKLIKQSENAPSHYRGIALLSHGMKDTHLRSPGSKRSIVRGDLHKESSRAQIEMVGGARAGAAAAGASASLSTALFGKPDINTNSRRNVKKSNLKKSRSVSPPPRSMGLLGTVRSRSSRSAAGHDLNASPVYHHVDASDDEEDERSSIVAEQDRSPTGLDFGFVDHRPGNPDEDPNQGTTTTFIMDDYGDPLHDVRNQKNRQQQQQQRHDRGLDTIPGMHSFGGQDMLDISNLRSEPMSVDGDGSDSRSISTSKKDGFLAKVSLIRARCGDFVNSDHVQYFMSFFIIVNSILLGALTFREVQNDPRVSAGLENLDIAILTIFTVECSLHFVHLGPIGVVRHGWILFDTVVVITSWAFANSSLAVLRAFRIFRIFSLVQRYQSLKTLFVAIGSTIPRMASIWIALMLVFYIFCVLYTTLYQDLFDRGFLSVDYFGRLDLTFVTLFQVMTLDNWSEVAREVMAAQPLAFLGFFIFIIFTSFFVINLVVAVICESLIQLHRDEEAAAMMAELQEQLLQEHDDSNLTDQQELLTQSRLQTELEINPLPMDEDEEEDIVSRDDCSRKTISSRMTNRSRKKAPAKKRSFLGGGASASLNNSASGGMIMAAAAAGMDGQASMVEAVLMSNRNAAAAAVAGVDPRAASRDRMMLQEILRNQLEMQSTIRLLTAELRDLRREQHDWVMTMGQGGNSLPTPKLRYNQSLAAERDTTLWSTAPLTTMTTTTSTRTSYTTTSSSSSITLEQQQLHNSSNATLPSSNVTQELLPPRARPPSMASLGRSSTEPYAK